MPKVFISYRRAGAHPDVETVIDGLVQKHGPQSFVRDVAGQSLSGGYRDSVERAMRECAGTVVVAGPEFDSAPDALGRRRMEDPDDPLRVEIEAALKVHKMMVVVALVGGAELPPLDVLPRSLRPLHRRGVLRMGASESFEADSGYLRDAVRRMVDGSARRAIRNVVIIFLLVNIAIIVFIVLQSAQLTTPR